MRTLTLNLMLLRCFGKQSQKESLFQRSFSLQMPHKPEQEKGDEDPPKKVLSDSIDDLRLKFAVLAGEAKGLKSETD